VEEDQPRVVGNGVWRVEDLDFTGEVRAAEERRCLLELSSDPHHEPLVAATVDRLNELTRF